MHARTSILLLLAVAVVAAAGSGCGDDSAGSSDGDDTIETSSLTKAQFIKEAGKICTEGNKDLLERVEAYQAKHQSSSKGESEEVADSIHQVILPEVETQIEQIEDLGAPAGDETQVETFLEAQRRSVESLAKRQSLTLQPGLEAAFRKPGGLASRYGLEACAYG